MRIVPNSSRLAGRSTLPRSTAGISLVELMVVVTIISMIIMFAVPSYQRVQRKARASTIANDFKVFAAVFQARAHEAGSWPAEAAAGVVPTGITSQDLKTAVWTQPTPIGGKFDWENNQVHNGVHYRAAIAISDTAGAPLIIDLALFRAIDQVLDDGNLATGSFILGDGVCPLFILEP